MLIKKAVCDQDRCKKEFYIYSDNAYSVRLSVTNFDEFDKNSDFIADITLSTTIKSEEEYHFCGKECLMVFLSEQIEKLRKENKNGKQSNSNA